METGGRPVRPAIEPGGIPMFRVRFILMLASAWVCALHAPSLHAQSLPPVNLGFTTFKDGGYPAGPGTYFCEYFQYYRSARFLDRNGRQALPDPNLNSFASLSQLCGYWDYDLGFGAKP